MLEKEFYIAHLIAASITGSLTPDEDQTLNAWIAESEQNKEYFGQCKNEDLLADKIRDYYHADGDAIYQKINLAINESATAEPVVSAKNSRWLWPRIAVAASALLILTIGGYLLLHKPSKDTYLAHDILPGGNKAFLVLGNGQRISLTDARNGSIAKQSGSSITKTADGMVAYNRSNADRQNTEQLYNTIETPHGGQYQITLADGTKVWLNAASSIKYPAVFTGNIRQVELNGEAYFEVAKDKKHPFIVKTSTQTVEVLGTHFDINSYPDEKNTATTLLEGSVKLTSENKQVIIKPGDQAVNNGQQISVAPANIDNVMDWRNGDFYLNRVNFRVAMRKIARWYDVEVIYDASVPDNIESGGWISRNRPLSAVLNAMEHTGQVHFRLEGKKLYVSK